MSLKKQALAGVKWTTVASVMNTVLQLIQLAILARHLNPSDFGLMALVMVVIGFSQMFIDMGLSNAIIYKKEIHTKQLSSLYWLNVIIGVLFFILLTGVSPLISKIYENEKLALLINIVAVTFLIKPWGQQFMVLLQKNLSFSAIAKTDIASRFISFIVIVFLAYDNYGVYSLAIGAVVFAFCTTLGYIFFGIDIHRPIIYLKINDLKDFLSFGLFQMGEKIIQYFASQFDTILIGKLLGLEVLGIYNIAKNIVSKPSVIINPVVTKVTFPLMSKINNDVNKLKAVFLKSMNYLSFVNFPVYFLIAVLARPLVLIMFGEGWDDAVPLIQILAFTFLLRSIGNPSGSLLLSRGKANVAFYWNLILFIFYPISIMVGSLWGIVGITIGTLILQIILLIPNWKFIVNKYSNTSIREFFGTLRYPFIISLSSIIPTVILVFLVDEPIILILSGGFSFAIIFMFVLKTLQPDKFWELKQGISGFKNKKIAVK